MGFDVQKYTVRRMQTSAGAICDVLVSVDVFAQRYMTGKPVTSYFDNVNRSRWLHQGDIFDKFSLVLESINRPQLTPRLK